MPKDYEFEEEELVHIWIVEGLLQKPKGNKQQEDLGHEYFYDLLLRSIFQQSSGEAYRYVMHDLVSDLAQWVSGEMCFSFDDASEANRQQSSLEKVRHYSYVCDDYDGKVNLKSSAKLNNLSV